MLPCCCQRSEYSLKTTQKYFLWFATTGDKQAKKIIKNPRGLSSTMMPSSPPHKGEECI